MKKQSEPLFSQPAEVLEVQTFVLLVKYKFLCKSLAVYWLR